jgi:GAF domain-containing protein
MDDVLVTGVPVTIGRLADVVGPGVAQLVLAPRGDHVEVDRLAIYDPGQLDSLVGALVLTIGSRIDDAAMVVAVANQGRAGAVMTVVSTTDEPPSALIAEANRWGLALMQVRPETSWSQLHTLFASVLSSGGHNRELAFGDLFALANSIAGAVGGAVAVEDERRRILAYSTLPDQPIDEARRRGILGRQVPDEPSDAHVYGDLYRHIGAVAIEADEGMRPRLAVAVRAGGELLGSLWVVEGDTAFGPQNIAALEEGARLVALHFLRARADEDVARRSRVESVRALIEGSSDAAGASVRLGFSTKPVVVLMFTPQVASSVDRLAVAERLTSLIAGHCSVFRRVAAVAPYGDGVIAVVSTSLDAERSRELAVANDLVVHLRSATRLKIQVNVGRRVEHAVDAVHSAREAVSVQAVRTAVMDDLVAFEQVEGQVVLNWLADAASAQPWLMSGPIDTMRRIGDSDDLETLRAYFDASGDKQLAAQRLGLHVNTMRYRMKRIEAAGLLNVDDPTTRLVAWLQLAILDLQNSDDSRPAGVSNERPYP